MIQFIAGEKGQGKTKKLIDMANKRAKISDGHVVFIDVDKRHMYDLHYDIRYVLSGSYPLFNYRELIGFICGILSQDNDITDIFIDGLTKIIRDFNDDDLVPFVDILKKLTDEHNVSFIVCISYPKEKLPEEVKEFLV